MDADEQTDTDAAWLQDQRALVASYLAADSLVHGGIAAEPDWYEPDVLALWPVNSAATPTSIGWWAVSGDVPTDYITATRGMEARGALAAIAARWQAAAARMKEGQTPVPDFRIGSPEDWPSLAPMLKSRADTLAAWAADPELWP